jgi:fatty-acyl-CoA synthase
MIGYWNRPDETAEALRDGWLRTGDLAVVDHDGYLTIVDRKKDVIVSGGENIASVEVEKAIAAHPAVAEVAVIGVADERWGEVPRAFVSLKADLAARPSEREIIDWVRERLAHFKAPKSVVFLDALPQGGTGKIQKTQLRDL